jgi:ABC-type transport system involved in cytochrome bd biosynthesis fused ATPase/permease subunit
MENVIGLITLVVLAAWLIRLGVRAWRAEIGFMKWVGAGLAAMMAVAVSSVSALTIARMAKQHARSAPHELSQQMPWRP